MTMEQTRRIAVFFDSDDDEAAIEKANQILKETPSEDYESGDKEYDYGYHKQWSYHLVNSDNFVIMGLNPIDKSNTFN